MDPVILVMLGFCFVMMIYCLLMLVRNKRVGAYRIMAIEIASKKAKNAIKDDDYAWEKFYDKLDKYGSYDSMLYSLTKWKYEDFYPDWKED